jgi:hypothetical protein
MRKVFALFYLAAAITFARAEDTAQVSGVIDGKQLQLLPEVRQKLVDDSIRLLASCGVSSLQSTNTYKWPDVERQSHLTYRFTKPVTVELPIAKLKVEVSEMVISLPLYSSVIRVRSDHSTSYFTKFTPETFYKLEATLKEAQKP